ncbi:DinB family protein [Pseudoduganella danionis]|uniref:DinB family protein n=1 Tax=Pseudoduganella danionis TaxID=1890295 RepID=UPI0035AF3E99
MTPASIQLLAQYNAGMNQQMYAAAAQLPHAELVADRKAYFGSILGTMNHLLVGDTIWLRRFAGHPASYSTLAHLLEQPPVSGLTQSFGDDLPALLAHRRRLDALILDWSQQVTAEHLALAFAYRNIKNEAFCKHFGSLVLHFFNHQTHHRGQISTLLFQAGVDVGVTDLPAWIPMMAEGSSQP